MVKRLVATLVIAGLLYGIWALWPRDDPTVTPTTLPQAAETTTTTTTSTTTTPTSTTTEATTTSSTHVVTTTEEAERILTELWYGWFQGIYLQDENLIRQVVATQAMVDAANRSFGVLVFRDRPRREGITFIESEVLRSDDSCLVIWSQSDALFLEPGPPREGVDVLRWVDQRWKMASAWVYKEDLWRSDCDAQLQDLS